MPTLSCWLPKHFWLHVNVMTIEQIEFDLSFGKIAALAWGPENAPKILAMHGWLDNAASILPLAKYLENFRVISIDLPGHGLSEHKPKNSYIHFIDYVADITYLLEYLDKNQIILIGHSLGAAIATILAGTSPDKVSSLILLDGLGPLTIPEEKMPGMLQASIKQYKNLRNKNLPVYNSLQEAENARLKAADISKHAVEILVARGIQKRQDKYYWRTDPRLLCKPLLMLSDTQVNSFLENITAPTCLIRPEPGWKYDHEIFEGRTKRIKNLTIHKISGNHHVHMDHPDRVGPLIQEFLK